MRVCVCACVQVCARVGVFLCVHVGVSVMHLGICLEGYVWVCERERVEK